MMGREGGDAVGHHWHPHLMLWLAHTDGADWGAGLHGSPIIAEQGPPAPEPITIFDVLVPLWSDGAPVEPH
jgi:hypothetical protein